MPAKIHSHNKVVESRILVGELTNVEYNLVKREYDALPIYEVGYGGNKYSRQTTNVLRKTKEQASAIVVREEALGVGSSYRVEAHTFHQAIVEENVDAATIVCMHSGVAGPAKVLGLKGYPDEIAFRRSSRPIGDLLGLI